MKQLLILSGKGGTGKTTTASAFIRFSEARAFADCDVDAPNLHLAAGEFPDAPEMSLYYGTDMSMIDKEKCVSCGLCAETCKFGAIRMENGKYRVKDLAVVNGIITLENAGDFEGIGFVGEFKGGYIKIGLIIAIVLIIFFTFFPSFFSPRKRKKRPHHLKF